MNWRLFLLASLTFVFLTVLLIASKSNKTQFILSPLKPAFFPSPTLSPWVGYSNSDYGYSLKYPRCWQKTEWDIQEASKISRPQEGMIWQQAKFDGKGQSFQVVLWANRQKAPAVSWLRWYRHEDLDLTKIPAKSNYQILGKEAYLVFQEKTSWGFPVVRIFFLNDDKIFELIAQNPSENLDKAYTDILTSFRLLEVE